METMKVTSLNKQLVGLAIAALSVVTVISAPQRLFADETPVDYVREVQPILARNCFACHGPDEGDRQADLRLDQREAAIEFGAIVPGEPEASELVARILSDDKELRMPPPSAHEALTGKQKEILSRWIQQGATYKTHWAFVPPVRPQLPREASDPWSRGAIDAFVLATLRAEKLTPSPETNRYTLIRRVYLDLTGLPPTIEQADAFVADQRPDAYERLVDRLLASPDYGQHWARRWLDLARYADTNGYEKDRPRSIWPYRDWVIEAITNDLPYDQFTIEQLAGDMLPDATPSQLVATGFHRNTMLNEEGGIDPLEYRFHAMVDRVATTGSIWLGLSTGCAQCHTHKYDPITHTDYYRLMALLNNADEPEAAVRSPEMVKRRDEIQAKINMLEDGLLPQLPDWEKRFQTWAEKEKKSAAQWNTFRPAEWSTNLARLELEPDGSLMASGDSTKRDVYTLRFNVTAEMLPLTALRLEALIDERLPGGGPGRAFYEGRKGNFFLSEFSASFAGEPQPWRTATASAIGSRASEPATVYDGDGSTGWSLANSAKDEQLVLQLKTPIKAPGELTLTMLFERHYVASLGRFRFAVTSAADAKASALPTTVESLLADEPSQWGAEGRKVLQRYFASREPDLAEARKPIDQLKAQLPGFPTTLVMQERPADNPRSTHRHHRGEYLNPKELVEPALPSLFQSKDKISPVDNRLAFAHWLVSEENPLAARVAVNRAWRSFFGRGLVKTSGDFGVQSNLPSHPELLDWLAVEFQTSGWSQKRLHRLIVTSATYRQQSGADRSAFAEDPDNQWLARGPRFRVDAESVRDAMLAASGMLSRKAMGPSVFPPQPATVTSLAFGGMKWNTSQGADRYRRSLYTFSKRTAPFAAYAVFDAPSGETCQTRRNRSNSPLQALTLLNDKLFLELAQSMVVRDAARHADDSFDARATRLFRRLLTRPPSADELQAISQFHRQQVERLQAGELQPEKIAGKNADANTAAWVMTARVLMNLDEAITKQ